MVDSSAFWRILGLAARARKIVSGTDAVELNLRKNNGSLLLLADDMADSGAEKLGRLADTKSIRFIRYGSRHELGHWIGKNERVAILVTDKGFADRLLELYTHQKDTDTEA